LGGLLIERGERAAHLVVLAVVKGGDGLEVAGELVGRGL
jgi:hypothetical protein